MICADPPWLFGSAACAVGSLPHRVTPKYDLMDLSDICWYFAPHAGNRDKWPVADDALLFLWRCSGFVVEAYEVVRSWGFTPRSEIVWVKKTVHGKRHMGPGCYVRGEHETCIVASRGKVASKLKARNIRSTFEAPVSKHSAKPEIFYTEIVERMFDGPYLELFARKTRPGWTCTGNEVTP